MFDLNAKSDIIEDKGHHGVPITMYCSAFASMFTTSFLIKAKDDKYVMPVEGQAKRFLDIIKILQSNGLRICGHEKGILSAFHICFYTSKDNNTVGVEAAKVIQYFVEELGFDIQNDVNHFFSINRQIVALVVRYYWLRKLEQLKFCTELIATDKISRFAKRLFYVQKCLLRHLVYARKQLYISRVYIACTAASSNLLHFRKQNVAAGNSSKASAVQQRSC